MAVCLYGTKQIDGSPSSFTIDVGAICTLLNVDSPICPLLDKIPSLVGASWQTILKEVARSAYAYVVEDRVQTAAFCSMQPPKLPSDITYAEVFELVASYVPPFSTFASSSPVLKKLTDYYLYTKWFEFCECKREEEQDEPDRTGNDFDPPSPLPRLSVDPSINCPDLASRVAANNVFQEFEQANNASFEDAIQVNSQLSFSEFQSIQTDRIATFYENYSGSRPLEPQAEENYFNEPMPARTPQNFFRGAGCLGITLRVIPFVDWFKVRYEGIIRYADDGSVRERFTGFYVVRLPRTYLFVGTDESFCNCQEEEEPRLPKPPSDPRDCIPVPPPKYCELFPNDILCSNVPPPPPNEDGDCELIDITVKSFDDCMDGQKTVKWLKKNDV